MNIKVSVVIPVYNSEQYLIRCLDSIVNQTLHDIEIILIDDGSTDNSYNMLKNYASQDSRIKVYTQKNAGSGKTRNNGFRYSTGEYVIFLDSDDFFELDMLELLYRRASTTKSDITFCDFYICNSITLEDTIPLGGVDWNLVPNQHIFSKIDCPNSLFQLSSSSLWNKLFRRDFLLSQKIFFPTLRRGEDFFFVHAAFAVAKRISCLKQRLIHYCQNENSLTHQGNIFWKDSLKIENKLYQFLKIRKLDKQLSKTFINAVIIDAIDFVFAWSKEPNKSIVCIYLCNFLKKIKGINLPIEDYYKKCYIDDIKMLQKKAWLTYELEKQYNYSRENIIPILYCIDTISDIKLVAVSCRSILEHASENYFYDIYLVIKTKISQEEQQLIDFLPKKNLRVTWLELERLSYKINLVHNLHPIFFLSEYFYGYKKILYLSKTVIFLKDVALFFKKQMNKEILMGFQAQEDSLYVENTLGQIFETFFRLDVLLIDFDNWQKNNILHKADNIIHSANIVSFHDKARDLLNICCEGAVSLLDNQLILDKPDNAESSTKAYMVIYSAEYPWNNPLIKNADIWWFYARKTRFYEEILLENLKIEKNDKIPQCFHGNIACVTVKRKNEIVYSIKKEFIRAAIRYILLCLSPKRKIYAQKIFEVLKKYKEIEGVPC